MAIFFEINFLSNSISVCVICGDVLSVWLVVVVLKEASLNLRVMIGSSSVAMAPIEFQVPDIAILVAPHLSSETVQLILHELAFLEESTGAISVNQHLLPNPIEVITIVMLSK